MKRLGRSGKLVRVSFKEPHQTPGCAPKDIEVSSGLESAAAEIALAASVVPSEGEDSSSIVGEAPMTTNVRRAGHIDRFKLRVKQLSRSSFSTSSLDFSASAASAENCRGGKRGLSLAASGKILTNIAVNWRARSVQAKNERRERRATKTLAIVLGTTLAGGY